VNRVCDWFCGRRGRGVPLEKLLPGHFLNTFLSVNVTGRVTALFILDSAVCIETLGIGTGRTIRGSDHGEDNRVFSSSKGPDRLWNPTSLLFNGFPSSYKGLKRPKSESNHWSPSSAKVKKEKSYTSTPICVFMVS